MNVYSRKQKLKTGLFLLAILLGVGIVLYTGNLVKKISVQERNKIEIWAEATRELTGIDINEQVSPTLYNILGENKTIPVMLVDGNGNIIGTRNLNPKRVNDTIFLKKELQKMKNQHKPIVIEYAKGQKNYVYYEDSVLLTALMYYPYIQVVTVMFFILISYLAFSSSRKAEENQLWAGLSKETAHQLGTPISSLVAWIELLKLKNEDANLINEVQKDVKRLEIITERFSGIGSTPVLMKMNLYKIIVNSVSYLQARTSKNVKYILNFDKSGELLIPLNESLFEWVIENMCKNAVDTMQGRGQIIISVEDKKDRVFIDIHDFGKGIPKAQFKTVFKPGYTTKKRGWGLGLSLVKRIIESYHSGKIFVKSSELGKETTFRIVLNK
ncbi:MAG: HAMP domain-containing histidine kinase [Chlorobi bacterium]|nr:HAMP domain-containing histidine kinase [Chlorobiota bacterium]